MTKLDKGATGTSLVVGAVVVMLLILGAIFYANQPDGEEVMTEESREEMMNETRDEVMVQDEGKIQEKEGETMAEQTSQAMAYSGQVLAGKTAPLLEFNQADYNQAIAEGKLVVLYFYANWCPICRAEFPLAEAAFNQLTTNQVVGFRVNFNDNETDNNEKDLARKHGVPYQHTKVLVKGGEQLLKSPAEWDTQRYLDEIERRI